MLAAFFPHWFQHIWIRFRVCWMFKPKTNSWNPVNLPLFSGTNYRIVTHFAGDGMHFCSTPPVRVQQEPLVTHSRTLMARHHLQYSPSGTTTPHCWQSTRGSPGSSIFAQMHLKNGLEASPPEASAWNDTMAVPTPRSATAINIAATTTTTET